MRSLVITLLIATTAHASTSDCAKAVDGTACSTSCIAAGTCMAARCVPTKLRADGMACSSENLCTSDDSCQNGVCVPGPAVVCPDASPCDVGICDPSVGCSTKVICAPDLSTVPTTPADLGTTSTPTDLGTTTTPTDLATIKVNDMCYFDPSLEFVYCTGDDGQYSYRPDMATVDYHVRGSRINDCAVGGSDGNEPVGILCWILAIVMVRRRRITA